MAETQFHQRSTHMHKRNNAQMHSETNNGNIRMEDEIHSARRRHLQWVIHELSGQVDHTARWLVKMSACNLWKKHCFFLLPCFFSPEHTKPRQHSQKQRLRLPCKENITSPRFILQRNTQASINGNCHNTLTCRIIKEKKDFFENITITTSRDVELCVASWV